ncbi:adenylosuccinate lyase, partial [bacterium]|nr:adenylosuccinate lyase [bacterium]
LDVWQEVEALVVEAWESHGTAPAGAGAAVRSAPPVDIAEWKAREAVTHHDVAAFVDVLATSMDAHGEWLHYGLTSSDVLDTAQGVLLKEASGILLEGAAGLFETVRSLALTHRDTVMVGRTHGIWAEPTTFGLKAASWAFDIARGWRRLVAAADEVSTGTISGAVGTYATVPPDIEEHVMAALGLDPEPAPTQVVARDRHAAFLAALALLGATIERIAVELRHLQRSEVAEAVEAFRTGQKGSSAMPHKRNPIRAENLTGLARLLRGWSVAAMENVALWHERDISHSSVERVAIPDACLTLDFALARMTSLLEGLVVDSDRMKANLDATGGLVSSQAVLLALVETGMSRNDAYRIVQRHAAAVWDEGADFADSLVADPDVPLDEDTIASLLDPARAVRHAGVVFDRLEAATL